MNGGCTAGRDHPSWDKNVLSEDKGDNSELITLYWFAVSLPSQGINAVKPFHWILPHSMTEPPDPLRVSGTTWLLRADVETCISSGQRGEDIVQGPLFSTFFPVTITLFPAISPLEQNQIKVKSYLKSILANILSAVPLLFVWWWSPDL